MKTYQVISRAIGARNRCIDKGNSEWEARHQARIDDCLESFPSGSGFDSGTKLDDASTPEKLIFTTSYHHMSESGMYDGWTEHQVIVTTSLEMGHSVRITGKDRNQIKEYIHDIFADALNAELPEFAPAPVQAQPEAQV